jgi:hypothetical protein
MNNFLDAAIQPGNEYSGDYPDPPEGVTIQQVPIFIPELVCGVYWRPRPSKAVDWVVNIPSQSPEADLINMGFHAPPSWLQQSGWTRARTYWPNICGFQTFRDNASISVANAYNLQDYSNATVTPKGEPNPEFWRSGPWPYPTWPVYVYWWHRTH